MVLHLVHDEGGNGVTSNDFTKDVSFYTVTSRFVTCRGDISQESQRLWLPKDDLRDSSSWSSPPLQLLRNIHVKLITLYDCKEVCAPTQSKVNVGSGAYRLHSQDDVSHHQGSGPLSLPQLNHPQQRIVTTVEDSVLRTEMTDLETQEEDSPKCILFFKSMS
jgi:hypothetical protein